MIHITEQESSAIVSHEMAYAAVRKALLAAVDANSMIFPALPARTAAEGTRFTMKAGFGPDVAGVKIGFYWSRNAERGIPCHNSTIILVDQEKGGIEAVIEGGTVNAFRTAAADALAVDVLARQDAKVLALFGAGHQAEYEALAVNRVRPLAEVLIVNRDKAKAETLAAQLSKNGIAARPAGAREACENADIVVTVTGSRHPLFEAEWIKPGTHISAMGADAIGKQELPAALLSGALLFCDMPEQSRRIGEFQHRPADAAEPIALGDILAGRVEPACTPSTITVFDSSGISLQDLFIGAAILAEYRNR